MVCGCVGVFEDSGLASSRFGNEDGKAMVCLSAGLGWIKGYYQRWEVEELVETYCEREGVRLWCKTVLQSDFYGTGLVVQQVAFCNGMWLQRHPLGHPLPYRYVARSSLPRYWFVRSLVITSLLFVALSVAFFAFSGFRNVKLPGNRWFTICWKYAVCPCTRIRKIFFAQISNRGALFGRLPTTLRWQWNHRSDVGREVFHSRELSFAYGDVVACWLYRFDVLIELERQLFGGSD
jgi:hypothetical protein